jgi:hypothetical protein
VLIRIVGEAHQVHAEYLGELGEHFGNADFFQKFGAAAFGEIFWEEISVPGNRRAAFTKP